MWDKNSDAFMGDPTSKTRASLHGLTLWEYNGETWELKSIDSENGGVAGDPPAIAGRFKGQLRATPCVAPVAV